MIMDIVIDLASILAFLILLGVSYIYWLFSKYMKIRGKK